MEKLCIRRVERSDLDGCVRLEALCYAPLEIAPRTFIEKRIEIYPDGFYVAELNGDIVGMINTGATHKDDITDEELKYLVGHVRNGRNGVIFSLAVHPEFRERGIARMLVEKMQEVAEQKQKEKILLLCKENLIEFYTRLRFVYVSKSKSDFGGFVWHQMEYKLPVPAWILTSHHSSTSLTL